MRYIYFLNGIVWWMIFAYNIENNRDFMTWMCLLLSLYFFVVSYVRYNFDNKLKHKLMRTKKNNEFLSNIMHCCEINCEHAAVFHVLDLGDEKTYMDYTHCCAQHLVGMIGENTLHEVRRL